VIRLVRNAGSDDGVFVNFVLAELATDRGDHSAARDLYAAAAQATDVDAAHYRERARFGTAAASYRAGEHARAADAFAVFVSEHPTSKEVAAALYFRFKAIEALRTAGARARQAPEGEPPNGPPGDDVYAGALRAYLERVAEGEHETEVRYRLGEYHHGHGDCARALLALARPAGTDAWSLRARFLLVQCQAEMARVAWRADGPEGDVHYHATLDTVRELTAAAAATEDAALERLTAKACLLGSLLAAAAPMPRSEDVIELLGDFESRFPHGTDLAADAVALRVVAFARLGQAADARADIDRLIAVNVDGNQRRQHLRDVAGELMHEAEQTDPARRRALLPLVQHAYAALVRAHGKGEAASATEAGGQSATMSDLATLAHVSLELADLDGAAQAFDRLLDLDPESTEALRGIARTAEARGQPEVALTHWRQLAKRAEPGETLWYEGVLNTARMQQELGRPAQACAALGEAAARAPWPTNEEMGRAYAELRQRVCR
jgi:tetratricopeptide (TPR) repeat protein